MTETMLNPLSRLTKKLRQAGRSFMDLTVSNPTLCQFKYFRKDLLQPFADPKNLTYDPDPHGLTEAREAVRRYYAEKGVLLDPRQIFITASTSEAYSFIFRLLAKAGDTLLAPQPSYPLLDYLAKAHALGIHRYPLKETDWAVDFAALAREIPANTAALLLVHPNNPTGHYIQNGEREKILAFARDHSLPVIADEVFFDFNLEKDVKPRSFASNQLSLTFTLSGISKVLGLPQMKLAWMVVSGPEPERSKAIEELEIVADTYLSAGAPVQRALPSWMRHRETIQKEIRERLRENFKFLEKCFARSRVRLLPAQGGWSAVLKLPPDKDDEGWALWLLEKKEILVHPGYLYDFSGGPYGVLSLLLPLQILREGAGRIASL